MTENQRTAKIHELKCWTGLFQDFLSGDKSFDMRVNDRDFKVGDVLYQREFLANTLASGGDYTGRELRQKVAYVMRGPMLGLKEGWVIMSVKTLAVVL